MTESSELSSINTQLSGLVDRIARLATSLTEKRREDAAGTLYEVERLLDAAQRRLETVVDSL